MDEAGFDESYDVVVVGSGGGALVGAHVAALHGLRTALLESTDRFGGTSAYSGAGLWLPGNDALARSGIDDPIDAARAYLRAVIGDATAELQDAFLAAAGPMVALLEAHPAIEFEHRPFPDYFADAPHMRPTGRDIFPLPLARADLGALGAKLRPALPQERHGTAAPEELIGGQALIARLLIAAQDAGAELRLEHRVDELVVDEVGRVCGVGVDTRDGRRTIGARAGVLLAAGGFERNAEMRDRYGVPATAAWTMGAPGGLGGAIQAGIAVGADIALMDQAWWSPGVMHPDGSATFTLGLRGGIFVNAAGRRFANESRPYDQFGREVLELDDDDHPHLPFWYVFDDRFGDAIPANSTLPMGPRADYVDAGIWVTADTLEGLAERIGVPADALRSSVERFNGFSAAGVDADFHRGETPYDLFFATGDGPNPALVPIDRAPFHAVRFAVSDLGTKGGLVTDPTARVRHTDGSIIDGLYAAGNTMASMSGTTYPAPGTPIGTCMVFSYLAALDMIERSRRSRHSG